MAGNDCTNPSGQQQQQHRQQLPPCGQAECLCAVGAAGWARAADAIVRSFARVRVGEVVQLGGGVHAMPLLEALALAVRRAGAFPELNVTSQELLSRTVAETPLEYLRQVPSYRVRWLEDVDAIIATDTFVDPDALGPVSDERQAALAESQQPVYEVIARRGIRSLYVPFPTEALATKCGQSCPLLQEALRESLLVDGTWLSRRGRAIAARLEGTTNVRVVTGDGTDVTLRLAGSPFVEDGTAAGEGGGVARPLAHLPPGCVSVPVDPTSARGTVVVPAAFLGEHKIVGLRLEFEGGRVQRVAAAGGRKVFQDAMAYAGTGADRLALLTLGFNPALKALYGWEPLDTRVDGAVTFGLGDNTAVAGDHEVGWAWNLAVGPASLWVDGEMLIREGRWVLPE